jgi:ribosomal protein L37AE/L43A
MSKKWHAKRAGEVETDDVVVWSCSVCGNQLTRGAMKLAGKDRQKAADVLDSVPTDEYLLQR